MRIAVTGGSGFIGSHVVDHLVAAGHDVDVIDLGRPHRPDVGHHTVDIGDLDGLVAATAGAEVVFHLAAFADVNDVAADPVGATDANVVGTARVWEACRRNGVRRAVLASTVWVYGASPPEDVHDETATFDLDRAGHLYTSSKIAAEMVAHSYHELYDLDFTILRYGIPYGPRMRPALVIPKFVTMALAGDPITVHGDGSQFRNYVYVEDLAAAHVLALDDAAANQVLNLEGSERVTVRQLVDSIAEALDRDVVVSYSDARSGDYEGAEISAAKAKSLVGWQPVVPFDVGLRRYVDWHLEREAAAMAPALAAEVVPVAAAVPAIPIDDRRRSAATGCALASMILPWLVTAAHGSPVDDVLGLLAGIGGLALAGWWQLRARAGVAQSGPPGIVGAAAACAVLWLVAQAPYSWELLPLGALLGLLLVGTAPVIRSSRHALAAGLAAAGGLSVLDLVRPGWVVWAAALAIVGGLAVGGALVGQRRRLAWRWSVGATLATGLVASVVGATSASASWFGPVVSHGPRTRDEVALTFDGGSPADTRAVLDILDAQGVRAAFFASGETVHADPATAQVLVRHGQLIGDAGYSSTPGLLIEVHPRSLARSQRAIADVLGVCPSYVRPSRGMHTPLTTRLARRRDMTVVTWDVGRFAGGGRDGARLAAAVLSSVSRGSIIRLPLPASTALPMILEGLRARHLRPVRLDVLLGTKGYATRC